MTFQGWGSREMPLTSKTGRYKSQGATKQAEIAPGFKLLEVLGVSPLPHIQRAFPQEPYDFLTTRLEGERQENDLGTLLGTGAEDSEPSSSPWGSKDAPRRSSGVRVRTSPRALARTHQSTPFVRAKPGKEKDLGGPEKRPQEGRGTGGVRCVCAC